MSYPALAGVVLALVALLAVATQWRRRPDRWWWAATAITVSVLIVLTLVFDNAMIAAGLFVYGPAAGARVGLAPLADLAWPIAAGLVASCLWTFVGERP